VCNSTDVNSLLIPPNINILFGYLHQGFVLSSVFVCYSLQLNYAETIKAIFTIFGEGDKWPRKKAKMLTVIRITLLNCHGYG